MPIISKIGSRSLKARLLYGSIYLTLIIGSITMIYPLLLMLAGSVKSDADSWANTPYPEFWFNDRILFQKYAESKYNGWTSDAQYAWNKPIATWRTIEPPAAVDEHLVETYREWRETPEVRELLQMGHIGAFGMVPKNLRAYRREMMRQFDGDIEKYNQAANQLFASWSSIRPPVLKLGRSDNSSIPPAFRERLEKWLGNLPVEDTMMESIHGFFVMKYLRGLYTSVIDNYNKAHGTSYGDFSEIPFSTTVPPEPGQHRDDWETFARTVCDLNAISLDIAAAPDFFRFLQNTYPSITAFNKQHGTDFGSLEDVPFPHHVRGEYGYLRIDFETFLKDPEFCSIETVRLRDTGTMFASYYAGKHGALPDDYPGFGPLVAAVDWADCMDNSRAHRKEFTWRNYARVIDYILLHGNALRNTVIYCVLAVLTALIVNPLAAYALSRFGLPGTYKILLFCMATMAFPGEVAMIPGFMLRKRFPLWPLLTGLAVCLTVFWLLEKLQPKWRENRRALISLLAGIVTGGVILPLLWPEKTTVNLLNTFAALILPGMANGYSIFLLKGFFDSQPKELYEAADLDGASEWVKFWNLTINLSKPILAVIALGAFTAAYGNFMMALIIIPDQKMWTLMVWIFQLQSEAHQSVVYASLVVAAIPTFLVFVFCQNIILRGIVVPTEK